MDFDKSTQARSWMFDKVTLDLCRRRAALPSSSPVQKFASGFHKRMLDDDAEVVMQTPECYDERVLSSQDQEILVQFHAQQIQTLVGPTAVMIELCTSDTVLSTAITLFRRFYLSNSIVEVNPRKMAAASAFFAAKLEEERIEMRSLAHATSIIQLKVQNAPLCRQELRCVSVFEIEEGERLLMEGLNYQFRCHHPENAMRVMARDFSNFLEEKEHSLDERNPDESYIASDRSPCHAADFLADKADSVFEQASEIAQRALVFSDAQFLFAPGNIAFAIVAIVLGAYDEDGSMSGDVKDYLVARFPRKKVDDLNDFSRKISSIMTMLLQEPNMDLMGPFKENCNAAAERAGELKRVLGKVSLLRSNRKSLRQPSEVRYNKRSRFALDFTPPPGRISRKLVKVTPTGGY